MAHSYPQEYFLQISSIIRLYLPPPGPSNKGYLLRFLFLFLFLLLFWALLLFEFRCWFRLPFLLELLARGGLCSVLVSTSPSSFMNGCSGIRGTACLISFSISRRYGCSSLSQKESAIPLAFARPVRPILCT